MRTTAESTEGTEAVTGAPAATSLIVCSLEDWGTVRRRIRILVDELVDRDPLLQVLYVAPAVDVPFELSQRRTAALTRPRMEAVRPRIHVLRPRKWLPRSLGRTADRSLGRQVTAAATSLGLVDPLVWVNDAYYAGWALATGWPTIYDVTDDWLLAPLAPRQEARLRANDELLLARSGAVVVCSPDLARTRGRDRAVDLIPNGVDVELFRTPQSRPAELPDGPVAVYVGTLHESRLDVDLIVSLAESRPDLAIALVGPDSLAPKESSRLEAVPTVHRIGPQPYERVPGFLQHADVVVIPHLVNPFTESLDPIKAYDCLAAGRPTVATPVAGFRGLGAPIVIADRDEFVDAVSRVIDASGTGPPATEPDGDVASWAERADAMEAVMTRVRAASAAS